MGYVVLWIENLTVALLSTALIVACLAHARGVWRRRVWGFFLIMPILLAYALLTSLGGFFELVKQLHLGLFWPLLLLTACYAIGALWIWRRGMRRTTND